MFSKSRVMIVCAHPDDELLGPGATIFELIRHKGAEVHVVILGEGITSRSETRRLAAWQSELRRHKANIRVAQKIIGYRSLKLFNFPDNRFDSKPLLSLVKAVEKEKLRFGPDVVLTHHGGDLNIDHRRTFESVITACRPLKGEYVKTILTFETPSSTEWQASTEQNRFVPNFFVSVSKQAVNAKVKGMQCYEYERRQFPHPRSPEALVANARRWGSVIGSEYAEAFCLVRCMISPTESEFMT